MQIPIHNQSPQLSKEHSGKSPQHMMSPAILDFLEDDAIFLEESKRVKSKTEFVKRDNIKVAQTTTAEKNNQEDKE